MAYGSLAVANYFLKLAWEEDANISPMKIQKLVYFAHGWYLAIAGKPLIAETVKVWDYGPVVPELYQEFKKYGNQRIEHFAKSWDDQVYMIPGTEDVQIIHRVWDTHKELTAFQLSDRTHYEDSPWYKARLEGEKILTNDDIRNHFVNLAEQRRKSA